MPYLTTNNNINLYNIVKRFVEDTDQTKELRVAYSYSNLIYFEKEKSEVKTDINTLIITYIPEAGCIEDLNYYKTGERMTLNTLDKAFVGYIEYKKLNGEVIGLEYYMNVRMIARYSLSRSSKNNKMALANVKSSDLITSSSSTGTYQQCTTVCTPIYGQVCTSVPEHSEGGESCVTKVIGQSCNEVCVEVSNPENPTPGDGTPTPPTPSPQIVGYINDIFDPCPDMEVGSENHNKFISEVQELVSRPPFDCFTEKMLQFLASRASSNGKISLCINSNIGGGTYNAGSKSLQFKNIYVINRQIIFHELFHACQDKIYPNGINQYTASNGKVEIEFETHLFIDLVGRIGSEIPTASKSEEYRGFLNGLTTDNNGNRNLFNANNFFADPTVASNSQYKKYKEEFRQYKSIYNPEAMVPSLPYNNLNIIPATIQHFLENTNCYQ
ncbi:MULTISPECIES: hypothetical protein [Sphingobacterium]|uniref:hypothetical protein n=1 Tax=Sphingobacterium TaxID=28453 RepID=UPI0013DB71A0|nr:MULTISPECIES: hypothetical protein [unclassified Sphingobacterium]